MQFILLVSLSMVGWASATYDVESVADYHEQVAIPLAAKIKAVEDAILDKQNTNSRIVGGVISRRNAHPFLAGLLVNYPNEPRIGACASVLVSPIRLLTAAHCWADAKIQASRFVVVLGSHFLFSGGDRIPSSKVVTYPGWKPATAPLHNNLAIIYLPTPARLTVNIQPIAMASNPSETFVGEWAIVAGYGKTSQNQTAVPVHSVVSEVRMQVITVEQCRRVFPNGAQPNTICTDGTGGVGICNDSGAPLFITRNGRRELIGIATFRAAKGCDLGLPSGFQRITSYRDFIDQHV